MKTKASWFAQIANVLGGNRRALLAVVAVAALIALSASLAAYLTAERNGNSARNDSENTYANRDFAYSLSYPRHWISIEKDGQARLLLLKNRAPNGIALEINCTTTQVSGDAETTWRYRQSSPDSNFETAVGTVELGAGTTAFKATGQGQLPYTVYTTVHDGNACQLVHPSIPAADNALSETAARSFRWN